MPCVKNREEDEKFNGFNFIDGGSQDDFIHTGSVPSRQRRKL